MSQGAVPVPETEGGATTNGPESSASTLIGTTLGEAYRITRLIAQGGMSAVYEAIQLRLNQRLAVKVMARELASNPEALARFQREAEVTSSLRHPNLVTVMDFGTAPAGQPYLVMEYLEGIDLDHRLRLQGKLALDLVVHVTKQVASALAAAHDRGIVHRDLKPANIFLVELPGVPEFAKVLDFGISKVRAAGTQLTKASSIMGTPNYMSPEQASGMIDDIDHRTDQWALACIVWEALSGRTPFASDDMSAVFYQVIHLDPQPLHKRVPELPPAVEAVLRRALSKNITDRFPSILAFADALAEAAAEPTGESASRDGAWVERRHAGRERRRSDSSLSHGDTAEGPLAPWSWPEVLRRLKPIHLVPALVILAAVLILLARPRPPSAPPPAVRAQVAAVPAAPATPAPPPPAPPLPSVPPAIAAPAAGEVKSETAPTARPAKPKVASAEASPRAPSAAAQPSQPAKRRQPGSETGRDDADDPFAPTPPKRAASKSGRTDKDFVDPFGP